MPPDVPVILVRWEATLGELLDRTLRFPKAVRFTFASRIDNLGLDLLDQLVQARWAQPAHKAAHLREADIYLARLRALLRLSHQRRYLDTRGYEHLARELDEVGRQLGGWRGHVDGRADNEPPP
jgi:hypothetical protein